MKSSVLTLSLSFLFFALLTKPLSGHPDPLLDLDGEKVEAGWAYYIISAIRGAGGGGLTLSFNRNGLCPLDVTQHSLDLFRGYPMFFFPTNYSSENRGYVHESMDVNILFYANIINCNEPMVWKVDNYDEKRGAWFITTNGVIGNPGPLTMKNWFKFVKIGDAYKIVHCPSDVSGSTVNLCSDVGINFVGNVRHLALTSGQPFRFRFVKAQVLPS
ncbi:hypothetical protein Ddye_001504 [Dipteronia dyeriana]|uniref:Uncharacterized protein n=1 Tax=Dipteronia dyeriana TaxID=168575 RepID=A0AAD9XPD5_9ROSI|nr:hypothetical protein Ddye_001501 [Dipteronia dyeriana]KAK2662930.1 hypothetical protein Ddye_001504 [Dipteronia dyeriana]